MLDDLAADGDLTLSTPAKPAEKVSAPPQPQLPPPPKGDSTKADQYTKRLIKLITENKVTVFHTDLKKFDLSSLQDHYRIDLGDYEVEVSHSKQPDTGKDFYVMLFNNLKRVQQDGNSCINKVILAYTHLTETQFKNFKEAALDQLERIHKAEEAKRFKQALAPIDQLLENRVPQFSTEEPNEIAEKEEKTDYQEKTSSNPSPNIPLSPLQA